MFRRFNRKQVFILSLLSVILCVERSIGSSVQDRQARWKPRNPHESFPVLGRRGSPNGEGKAGGGGGRRKGGGRGEGVNSVPPHPEFYQHTVITPKVYHSRSKRSLHHTRQQDGVHVSDITLAFTIGEEDIVVDLSLNKELITKNYFEKYIHNGSHVVHRPYAEEVDMCHYQGSVQGRPDSWVAVSTCNGLSGVLYDGEDIHYIERIPSASNSLHTPHYLLHHAHLRSRNHTCGYTSKSHPVQDLFHDEAVTRLLRYKRSSRSSGIRGPYNSNSDSRYVELVLVADKSEYEKHGHEVSKIYQRCKDIANIVNALYQPLNIFIALVGVEVWKDDDQVNISTNGDTTLTNFLTYRKVRLIREYPNDNAQLLTGKVFDAGVVGKALKGPICTYQYSGGVNMDHSDTVGLVATTVAHEMGHNFGMEHDTEEECKCPNKRCIMAPSSGTKSPTHWSSCSHEYLALSFERSMDYCLRNKPTSIFDSPICGNGFVEPGEQCDCGLPEYCINPCCNASTCMLFNNATCATGHCCDLQTCRPRPAGYGCRPSVHECDLDEYCSGDSEYCPDDVHKEDGHECSRGMAYCFKGMCRTHEEQCRLLWGPTGKSSDDRCYKKNTEGNQHGNCGYNWVNDTYYKCIEEDVRCGMVHCMHLNERLEFGMESVSKVDHSFLRGKKGVVIPCRVALVDMGLDMKDPGLVPDGAKCGNGKMCVNQKCLPVADLKVSPCPYSCHGNGVCNSLGHCHCHVGYAPPYCQYPGLGGSQDSGPASNPHATKTFVVGLYVFFLGIVPLTVLLLCLLFYSRGTLKEWWEKKGRPATSKIPHVDGRKREGGHRHTDMSSPVSINGTVRSPTPPSSQGSKSNSPLLNGHAKALSDGPNPAKHFSSTFFGKHEGFTLTPKKDNQGLPTYSQAIASSTNTPSFAATAPPLPTSAPVLPRPPPVSAPKIEKASESASPVKTKSATAPSDSAVIAKPQISGPSLQTSTNPDLAKSVIRPAPLPPPPAPAPPYSAVHTGGMIGSKSAGSQSAMTGEVALRKAPSPPTRPLSVPDATMLHHSAPANPTSTCNSGTVGKASAVARLASFLSKKDRVDGPQGQPGTVAEQELSRSNTLSRKAAKINRESLMQLEISAPMQLQATDLPANLVPVRSAPDPPAPAGIQSGPNKDDQPRPGKVSWAASVPEEKGSEVGQHQQQSAWTPLAKNDTQAHIELTRMGSLREPSVTVRPPIPKFGSLRAPRPKSLPPTRPSEPPPRPPLPAIPGTPENEYLYDDCLNVEDVAPLAAGEVSPPESIYATIDEKTPEAALEEVTFAPADENSERKGKKGIFSFLYSKPKKKKKDEKGGTEPVYCNVTTDPSTSSSSSSLSPPVSNPDRTSFEGSEDGGLLSEIVSELSHREYENTKSKQKTVTSPSQGPDSSSIKPTSIKDKGIETTDSVVVSQSNSITNSRGGQVSWPVKKFGSEFSSKPPTTTASHTPSHTSTITPCPPSTISPICVTTSSPKSATSFRTTTTEPRGVFSYLKKSSSTGSGVSKTQSGVQVQSSASFSNAKPTPEVRTSSSNPKSLEASLAAVRAAGAAAGKAAASTATADNKKTLTKGDTSSKTFEALRSNFVSSSSSTKPFSTTTTTTATVTTTTSSLSTTTSFTTTPTVTTPVVQSNKTSNISSTIPSASAPKSRVAFPPDKIIFPPDKVLTQAGSKKGDIKMTVKKPEGSKGAKASSTAPNKVTSSGGKVTSPGSKAVAGPGSKVTSPGSKVTSPGSKVMSGKGGKTTPTGSKVPAGPKATSPQGSKLSLSSLGSKTSSNLSSSSSSSKASGASVRGSTPSRTSTGKADRSQSATPTSSTSSTSNEESGNTKSKIGVSNKKTVTRTEGTPKEKALPPDKGSSAKATEKQSSTGAGNANNHPGIKKGNKLSGSTSGNKVNSGKLVSPSKPLGSSGSVSSRNPTFTATTGTVAAMQQKFEKKDIEKEEDVSKKKSGKSALKGQTVKSTKPSVAPKPK
ncbi:uncharacterized protein LOC143035271 [Oratosquilla oratoria]|uniref:uncharacterized protein LOC143035271 n=1 Tax=Oratosquilla oratoria TaxID=337810 RepID=UPI003F7641BA